MLFDVFSKQCVEIYYDLFTHFLFLDAFHNSNASHATMQTLVLFVIFSLSRVKFKRILTRIQIYTCSAIGVNLIYVEPHFTFIYCYFSHRVDANAMPLSLLLYIWPSLSTKVLRMILSSPSACFFQLPPVLVLICNFLVAWQVQGM